MVVFNILKLYRGFDKQNRDWPQIYVILLASLGGFSSCALFSWPSPSIPILISNSSYIEYVTLEEASYFSIISSISTIVATPLVAILMNAIGRKKMITFMAIPHMLSWILIAVARNIICLYVSRAIYGISDAILYCVIPTYVSEIATPKVRGSWGNLIMISVFLGQFLINVVGAYYDIITTALVFVTLPIVHFALMLSAPESPYFLLMKNKETHAEESLKYLRWNENVKEEFTLLVKDVQRQTSESGTLMDLFIIETNRKALSIALAMRMFQQFSGFSAFAVYTQYMFSLAGGNLLASDCAIIFTGVSLLAGTLSSLVVDKFGRRPLMVFSNLGCTIALSIESIYFLIMHETNLNVSDFTWVPLAGMVLYIITSTAGLGILPSLMVGELFSASIKSKAVGVLSIFFSFCTIFVPKLFQLLSTNFHILVFVAMDGRYGESGDVNSAPGVDNNAWTMDIGGSVPYHNNNPSNSQIGKT
ncbi:hypothetical protein RN001_001349 [Aquatica leii]|uniref:Major facilitator superfamily (MFS) profile domain-containing protein n=1 Tax=Aquatica leii TaxID=1421715 RepID=A0AAN7QMU3_9COLE|nr:hypothetical protein RN001_001349 [Aquatica leii]